MDASLPPTIPRLRISRFSPQANYETLTPVAGPSHNSELLHADDDDEDAESTPRMPTSAIPDRQSPRAGASQGLPMDTPAARLRALLSRVPNTPDSATPHASSSRQPVLPPSSEPDSDFEPPYSTVTTSSVARESLKELFSRALRDPGNTPRKGKQRRNSIDASEVDSSPRVEEERAKYKWKRRSLSDEEAEKSKLVEPSERSFRSSSAASAFDALRQRLDASTSAMPTLPPEQMVMDMSMPPANSSMDAAMQRGGIVDLSHSTPLASSTPMRTFQMSAHLNMDTNLLDQDSEMQKALQGMDSYNTGTPAPRHRHNSASSLKDSAARSPRPPSSGPSHARPLSWSAHSKSHVVNNLPPVIRRSSDDISAPSSRASSSLSGADYAEREDGVSRERMHERERGWNSPVPKSPAHPGRHDPSHRHSWGSPSNGRASPAHRLTRKGSAASLVSTDDGRSSRASSIASRADHDERTKFVDQERVKEKEREWNKPHPKLSRSSSSLSLNKSERARTHSTPTRPDSAASYLSPTRATLHRHNSSNSLSSPSRPSSPTSSVHSVEQEVEHVIEHQRERNWNSPHPKWVGPLHHRRSLSPLPKSPAGSPPHTAPLKSMSTSRSRTNSTTQAPSLSSTTKPTPKEKIPRPNSPLLHSTAHNQSSSLTRAKSPVAFPSHDHAEPSHNGYKSHFGWSFPQKRAPLPPLELDQDSPRKLLARPSSRTSLTAPPSHIPVPSPRKGLHESSSAPSLSERKKSHRRSVTEFAESAGAIPPRIEVESDDHDELPPVPIVNGHHEISSASEDEAVTTGTPTIRSIPLASPAATTTPATAPSMTAPWDLTSVQTHNAPSDTSLVSPPPTPPANESQGMFSLQTPPRRPQFHTPRAVFETPPPPRGMPDLPGPPSSEDEEDRTPIMQSQDLQGDLTALKTPRPPGAWMATPAPSRQFTRSPVARAGSAPPVEQKSPTSDGGGLATPPSTLSRANSLPPQTPAPPGGWVNTPAPDTSARRKSALKVRFDVESETTSDGTFERPSADSSTESKVPPNDESSSAPWGMGALQNGDASAESAPAESSAEPLPAPPSLRERIRQRSPSIRLLDAYGREQPETPPVLAATLEADLGNANVPLDTHAVVAATPRRDVKVASNATPRSRSTVRMVDAMGREIEEEPVVEDDSVDEPPLSRREALHRMRETLASMAQELSDADRSNDKAVFDIRSYTSLEERCKASQMTRSKISKSLQMVQNAEVELKSKYAPLQDKMRENISVSGTPRLSWRLILWLLLLQVILLAIMYRYSRAQARKIFLTTYYDPFYPELYRYLVKPHTSQHSIPTCTSWSVSSVISSLQRAGPKGVATDAWASVSCYISSYIQSFWIGLYHAQDPIPYSWPPT
ncbi:hypothetical protein BC628DRAFT_1359257 [Trametes gibbosa]|nr:hypothetical protein BC628DRAFT_1359257 [Trametes gibbosa]